MEQKHSTKDVANTIKRLFKDNGIRLNDFAEKYDVSSSQLYAVLDGDKPINATWAVRFSMALGVEVRYCMDGTLPVIAPSFEFDKLLSVATTYKAAVEAEDKLRDEFDMERDELGLEEKAAYIKAISEARRNKMMVSAELAVLIMNGRNGDGKDNQPQTYISMPDLKLHEAIEMVIKEAGEPLSFTEIAKRINAKKLYSRKDKAPVPASQISARIKNYPSWFTVNRDETPATVSVTHKE